MQIFFKIFLHFIYQNFFLIFFIKIFNPNFRLTFFQIFFLQLYPPIIFNLIVRQLIKKINFVHAIALIRIRPFQLKLVEKFNVV